MFFISLVTGILLCSIFTLDHGQLSLILALVFTGMGFIVMRSPLDGYLGFVFSYPLVPSLPVQVGLPDFNFHEFLFLSFAFWWSVRNIGEKGVFRQKPAAAILVLFIVVCAFSSFLSLLRTNVIFSHVFILRIYERWNIFLPWSQLDNLATIRFFLNVLEGVLFFFITLNVIQNEQNVKKTLRAIFASAVCVSFLGILQYVFAFRPIVPWSGQMIHTRVNSTFSDPNSLGTYLCGALFIGICGFLAAGVRTRWKYLIGSGFIFLCLIFTSSRAAWAATCFTLLLFLYIAKRSRSFVTGMRDLSSRAISVVVSLILVALLSGLIMAVSMTGTGLQSPGKNSGMSVDEILMGRTSVWMAGLKIFSERPVFGCGVGTFPQELDKYEDAIPALYRHENAHNYYLQVLVETGLIGFFLFFLIVLQPVWKGVHFLIKTPDSGTSLPVYALLGAILSILLSSLTGHPLLLLKLQYFFWSIAGMLWTVMIARGTKIREVHKVKGIPVIAGIVAISILFFGSAEVISILNSRKVLPYEQGFYNWEEDGSGRFRWTKGNSLSLLRVEGKVLKVPLRQLNADVIKNPVSVEISANGEVLDRVTFTNTDWKELKYYLPGSKTEERISIGLKPDRVFNPAREISGSSDARNLGIAVRPFRWEKDVHEPIGMYGKEKSGGFVWTRMQASFPLQQLGTTLNVPLFYNNPHEEDSLKVLLYWNDTLVKETWLHNKGWQRISLNLPATAQQRGIFTVKVSGTWNPGKLGLNKDYRDLGVGIRDFEWGR